MGIRVIKCGNFYIKLKNKFVYICINKYKIEKSNLKNVK